VLLLQPVLLFGSSTLWFPNRCLQVKTGTKNRHEKNHVENILKRLQVLGCRFMYNLE